MKGFVAVTDFDWFTYLSGRPRLEEVNFWRPRDTEKPAWPPGTPVLFKLKAKHGGWIVGYGVFARHAVLPAWLAWETFGEANGAATWEAMIDRIVHLRRDATPRQVPGDFDIGCVMLSDPVFLPRERWIRAPDGWPANVVQGKGYDLSVGEGARVWREMSVAAAYAPAPVGAQALVDRSARYGADRLIAPRLGQGIFRAAVIDAYSRSCAVTTEHSLPALEAAHIQPYGKGGEHKVANGLLLRSDIHRLFDTGYVTITPEYTFLVSEKLKDDYANGRSYYPLHGQRIHLPGAAGDHPSREQLDWHFTNRFRR